MASLTKVKKTLATGGKKAKTLATIWLRQRHHYGWHYKYSKVKPDVILFESFHGKSISDSPLHMLRAFLDDPRSKGFRIYYTSTAANLAAHRKLVDALGLDRVELVTIESRRYAKLLATAEYLVNNSSFPAYFIRRPEQHYIQTWHGTPLKTLGKQMRLGIESMYNVQHNFLQADMLTFPNEFTRDALMRDYNLQDLYTGKAALVGYPRNRVFFDEEKAAEIRKRYGLEGVETFAYMPTWRGANNYTVDVGNYRSQVKRFLTKIDAVLRDDQKMFYNFHTMVASKMGTFEFKHIFPFPEDADNYEFLNAMDVLVTDYSSVFFDFSITRRPIVLFVYDKDEYLEERGMYLDIEDLPFPKARTIKELTKMIESGAYRDSSYAGSDYERQFLAYDSPDNAHKCIDLLFEGEAEDVPVKDFSPNRERHWRTVEPCQQATLADIRTACEATDPDRDIIIFSKKRFDEGKSKLMHDHYRDGRNFIFKTNAYACTALEELLRKRNPRVRAVIDDRERMRTLPGLDVPKRPKGTVYAGTTGTSLLFPKDREKTAPASIEMQESGLALDVTAPDLEIDGIALTQLRKLQARNELDETERTGQKPSRSFRALLDEVTPSADDSLVIVDGTNRKSGEREAVALKLNGDAPLHADDKTAGLYPFIRNGATITAPYRDANGLLHITAAKHGSFLSNFKYALLDSVSKTREGHVRIRLRLRKGSFILEDFILHRRSSSPVDDIALPYTVREEGGWLHVESTFSPDDYPFREIYWDAYLILRHFGLQERIPIRMSTWQIRKLRLGNQQWRVGESKVLFTHIMKHRSLSFIFRDYYPDLDTYGLRIKEMGALAAYTLLRPYWNRKRIWLVFEKYCSLAQDNGFYFFDYCMSLPPEKRKHVFYVIDKSKPDYERVAAHDDNVIDFMSFKHILYSMAANLYIASDSRTHLYVWRNKPSYVRNAIAKRKIFFLQHGVTALKVDHQLFGRQGSNPMTYYLTTSQNEQDVIVGNFGYRLNQVPVLGFSRWDVLVDKSSAEKPAILVMPTWRAWLEEQDDDVFLASDYFKKYSSLIRNPELMAFLEERDATLTFFIHPKLSKQLKNFAGDELSERVQLVEQGSEPLNEIMMRCNALVTDYSSVCWDMLYMDKPVVFYQFDQEIYEKTVGSYIDLNEDLPGPVCKVEGEVVEALAACAERGFALTAEEADKAAGWFARKDRKNRERTYNFIIDKGF